MRVDRSSSSQDDEEGHEKRFLRKIVATLAEGLEKFLRLRVRSVSSYLDYFRATSA